MQNIEFSKEEPLYTTSVVANKLGITPDRLRSYDSDLFITASRKKTGKVEKRLYSQVDVEWLSCIRELMSKYNMTGNSVKALLHLLYLNPQMELPENDLGKVYKSILSNPNLAKVADKY